MTNLTQERCIPCKGNIPPLTAGEIETLKPQLPEWEIVEEDGVKHLRRVFKFPDFAQALSFANDIGEAAEGEDHHPRLVVAWGKMVVEWWTHAINGLHRNDFVMAAKTDTLFEQQSSPPKDKVQIASEESFPASDPPAW
jgi:4a-hydroxytetrahydrobiopterin dehydratase